jgi:hypothetical protein
MGYRGPRDANPNWGESGYISHEIVVPQPGPAVSKPIPGSNPPFAHWDPNFDQVLKVFKNAKPLGTEQHSMNEIHDHRVVQSETNIHVASASPSDLRMRSLGRPRNADLIRNTACYAA